MSKRNFNKVNYRNVVQMFPERFVENARSFAKFEDFLAQTRAGFPKAFDSAEAEKFLLRTHKLAHETRNFADFVPAYFARHGQAFEQALGDFFGFDSNQANFAGAVFQAFESGSSKSVTFDAAINAFAFFCFFEGFHRGAAA